MHILIFGDSITYGAWDTKGGWVQRLREILDKRTLKDINKYALVYNLGVSGDTSHDVLKRFEKEADARIDENEETMFIFSFGSNDCVFIYDEKSFAVTEADFVRNINELIALARIYSQKIVFVGLTPMDEGKTKEVASAYQTNDHLKRFNEIMRRICDEQKIHFIDVYDKVSKKDLEDGDHPNSKGHEKIFNEVKKYLEDNKLI